MHNLEYLAALLTVGIAGVIVGRLYERSNKPKAPDCSNCSGCSKK